MQLKMARQELVNPEDVVGVLSSSLRFEDMEYMESVTEKYSAPVWIPNGDNTQCKILPIISQCSAQDIIAKTAAIWCAMLAQRTKDNCATSLRNREFFIFTVEAGPPGSSRKRN
eukprot:TRINITY_DN28249_c0_g2_i2.p3 TRINITY_DN28249_c0_g2~~TRINITY_DN28249_c0_g2_i2.p3  ORF type:complete len:114 (+),score=25.51 TRINITY_DN28249_c0_g2_i2:476-817(+)